MREGEEAVWEVEQEEHWPGNSNSDSDISDEEEEDTLDDDEEDTLDDDEEDTSDDDEDTSDEEGIADDEEEETEDGAYSEHDDYLVEQDYMTQGVYLNHDDHVVTKMTRGVITHSHNPEHERYEQTAAHAASVDTITGGVITHGHDTQYKSDEKTAVHATSTNSFVQFQNVTRTPNRFLKLAGKAKEHLRDENNRKKAVETFQNGMREVTAFVAEIQAIQGAAGPKRVGQKGNWGGSWRR